MTRQELYDGMEETLGLVPTVLKDEFKSEVLQLCEHARSAQAVAR